jgi:Na+-driven multidrug efflux pump
LLARVSLCSWYIVGLPVAAALCFGLGMGLTGLWLGLACGPSFNVLIFAVAHARLD